MAATAATAVMAPQAVSAGVPRCDVFVLAADGEVLGLLSGQTQRPVLRLERVRLSRKVSSVAAYLAKRWGAEVRHERGRLPPKLEVCAATRTGVLNAPLFQLELEAGAAPRLGSQAKTVRDVLCCPASAGAKFAVLVARLAGSDRDSAPGARLPACRETLAGVLAALPPARATWSGCLAAVADIGTTTLGRGGATAAQAALLPLAGPSCPSLTEQPRACTAARADGHSGAFVQPDIRSSPQLPSSGARAGAGLGMRGIGSAGVVAPGAGCGGVRGMGASAGFGLTSLPLTQMGDADTFGAVSHGAGPPSPLLPRHLCLPEASPPGPSAAQQRSPREPTPAAAATSVHSVQGTSTAHSVTALVGVAPNGNASTSLLTSSVAALAALLASGEGQALTAATGWRHTNLTPSSRFCLGMPAPDPCPRPLPAGSGAAQGIPGHAKARTAPPPVAQLARSSSTKSSRRRLTPVLVQGVAQARSGLESDRQQRWGTTSPALAAGQAGADDGGLWTGEARECSGHPWEEALEVDDTTGRVVAGGRRGPSIVRRRSRLVPASAPSDAEGWLASDLLRDRPWPGLAASRDAPASTAHHQSEGGGRRGSERAVMEQRMAAAEASPARRPRPAYMASHRSFGGTDAAASREAPPAETGSSSAASDDSGLGWGAGGRPQSRRARRRIRPTVVSPEIAARESTDTPFSQASMGSVLAAGASRASL